MVGRDGRSPGATWRSGRRFLAAQARIVPIALTDPQSSAAAPAAGPRVRFGITVGKRNARRAVERATVKRVLREAARSAAAALDGAARTRQVDLVLRLKAPCPPLAELTRPQFKRVLRAEAEALLAQLAAHLDQAPDGAAA